MEWCVIVLNLIDFLPKRHQRPLARPLHNRFIFDFVENDIEVTLVGHWGVRLLLRLVIRHLVKLRIGDVVQHVLPLLAGFLDFVVRVHKCGVHLVNYAVLVPGIAEVLHADACVGLG